MLYWRAGLALPSLANTVIDDRGNVQKELKATAIVPSEG
jgi:hypothetical protein